MKYISLFSGIGGLELSNAAPEYLCDADPDCAVVLSKVYPNIPIYPDVRKLPKLRADVCLAGWPCQDLTSAGRQAGMTGAHSSLFFHAIEVAKSAGVHTFIGENVPNLLRLRGGSELQVVLKSLLDAGFKNISWRQLNARQFGLPQERERIIIVASRIFDIAKAVHRPTWPISLPRRNIRHEAAGFYWTGGMRSICYSEGFVPALKVGASPPKGGTSPVAIFYKKKVRKLSASECVKLQGFESEYFDDILAGSVFRMAGNAVPRPMGRFAADTAAMSSSEEIAFVKSNSLGPNGLLKRGILYTVCHKIGTQAQNLSDYIDVQSKESLSSQAAAGLLSRLITAGKSIPLPLFDALYELSTVRTKLLGTKVDSFKILHEELDPLRYRRNLLRSQSAELGLV